MNWQAKNDRRLKSTESGILARRDDYGGGEQDGELCYAIRVTTERVALPTYQTRSNESKGR